MTESPRSGSLAVIFLTVFIDLLGFGIVLPLLPVYAREYSTDTTGLAIGLLMASFSAMQFCFAPIWGRLSDRIGRRPVLIVGLLGSVVFYALFGIATVAKSLPLLFVARIGAGIAGATIATAQAYIADCTTRENRQRGMALIGMAFGLGFTFGPLLGFLAVPTGRGEPGPWPGYAAAILSGVALLMAIFRLPESLRPDSDSPRRRVFDWSAWRTALATPSVGFLLLAMFVCIASFSNFETTLSLLIKGGTKRTESPFDFTWGQVCLTYAFIGIMLALVQGGVVRRLGGRVSEGAQAAFGAVAEMVGFGLVVYAVGAGSGLWLFVALGVVVTGFAFLQPSLNSLLSRRSAAEDQGAVLGVGQSVSSLARIVGAGLGNPLLALHLLLPYFAAAGLMALGFLLVIAAARRGRDHGT